MAFMLMDSSPLGIVDTHLVVENLLELCVFAGIQQYSKREGIMIVLDLCRR